MLYNKEIAEKLIKKYNSQLPLYKKMYNYYIGKTDIENNYKQIDGRSNEMIKTNYIKKFITEHVAYGVGNEITYTHRKDDEDCIDDIEYNVQIQKSSIDSLLYKNMLIFGKAYELGYIYNDEIRFKVTTPLNSIAYVNDENETEMFIYFYKKDLDDTKYMDIYCTEGIYHFEEEFKEVETMTPSYLGVPVSIAVLDEEEFETIYNDIKTLQDGFEKSLSNWLNNDNDFRDSYFYTKNVEVDETFADKMKNMRVIDLPNSDSEAGFMTKNANADYVNRLVDVIEDKIYQISQSINSNEAMQSNTSGVAILSRIINLRNKINLEQKCLKDAIRNRLKILFKYLKIAYSKNYNYRDIKINFTMNVPSDDVAMAQIITQLNGKLSVETGLNQLSFIQNGKAEFEKMLDEQKKINDILESGQIDLDNIGEDEELI
ncbi:phage portal protein [Clostridium sp. UBA7791]|uniref:phage portal protein n=1 Tax=Clostridium sp. UBA7791 TaxID=1946379 RepID=UPI00321745DD